MASNDYWGTVAKQFVSELIKLPARTIVRAMQKGWGLKVDGKAGAKTFGKLRALLRKPKPVVFPPAPLCSWSDAVYPIADDHPTYKYRITSGYQWPGRNGKPHPVTGAPTKPHYAHDITRRHKGKYPDSDGYFGAPKGSRVVACLPGVVVDVDLRGAMYSATLRHNVDGEEWYTYYGHVASVEVALGAIVEAGQFIAFNGTTYTRPVLRHVHFTVCKGSGWRPDDYGWRIRHSVNMGGSDFGAANTKPGTDEWRIHEGPMADWKRVSASLTH